ncbi:MAG: amino acid permease [Blastocatellia bacterium]|nr:amino acid permease [Blastocatellia bacterium]MCS7157235.1 amino acid permease [Blastocatellia bacterium]MDW8256507.1 amino acid permease [Acidobacteriota bacterium]
MRLPFRKANSGTVAPASVALGEGVRDFVQGLGVFDATMLVVGIMIGSGIFIVSADMARQIGSPGGLLLAWGITGLLTLAGALSYGELAAMMPWAGGQYVFLREAFSPLWGFLYGWTLFLVIQTGTIAAVSVAFARFLGVLWPAIAEDQYLIPPMHLSEGYAFSLSTNQLIAIVVVALLTWANMRGVTYGKIIQNVFTVAKTGALLGLILLALLVGWNARAVAENFGDLWTPRGYVPLGGGLDATTPFGLFVALCVAQTGSLFAADAWHNVTFAAAEVKNPRRTVPLAMGLGVLLVIALYLLANVAYLVTLPLADIQRAPFDRVGTAALQAIFPNGGAPLMALAIMISTFGTINGLILAGARAYYAMARDGLFFAFAGRLNEARVPGWALLVQGMWAAALVLPRTFHPETRTYGNLYSNLLDYVISAALLFYILTILGIFRLRAKWPDRERPYRVWGYPVVPALYVVGAGTILAVLLYYRTATTWPGFVLVLAGVPVYGFLRYARARVRA